MALRTLGMIVILLAVGSGHVTAGEFQWTAASWNYSTTSSGQAPPYTTLTYGTPSTGGDQFSGSVFASASADPFPGGPSVTGRANFSRGFQVTGTPNELVMVTWTLRVTGSAGPSGIGSSGGNIGYAIRTDYPSVGGSDFVVTTGPNNFNTNPVDITYSHNYSTGPTGTASFIASGYIEANGYAFSGPGGSGTIGITFGIPVPESALLLPLAGLAVLLLRPIKSA